MCIPQFEIIYNENYIERTTAMIDLYDKKYYFPNSMIEAIKECRRSNIRLIYFTLIIRASKSYLTHANTIIIDLKKETLERFEPYGCIIKFDNIIDDFFKKFVLRHLELYSFKYLKPTNLSKKIGIQIKADAYEGMCVTISAMYLQMRVLNVNIKQNKIIEYFTKMSSSKLKNHILRFAKYIERTLKNNEDIVNSMNYYLFYDKFNKLKYQKNSMVNNL